MNRKASLLSLHNALNISKDSMEQDCFDNLELQLENFLFVRSFYEVMVETWKRSIEKLSTGEPVNLKSIFKGQLDAKGKTVNPAEEELWNEFKEKLTSQATPILDDLSGFYESIGKNVALIYLLDCQNGRKYLGNSINKR